MGPSAALEAHAAMLGQLRGELLECVRDALTPRPRAIALLDFPLHENVGDLSIWAGELAALEELAIPVAYACDMHGYRRDRVEARLGPDDPIVLHGGGNFGDVWPGFQAFRERVIRDFPDRQIVQLPQTVHYTSAERLARTREILAAHGGVTLLVRDEVSADVARSGLDVAARACPDSAFALGPQPAGAPTRDVVWLRRDDRESADLGPTSPPPDIQSVDWPDHWAFGLLRTGVRIHVRTTGLIAPVAMPVDRGLERLYARIAARRVAIGLRMISAGRTLVTDRLHGHILACLVGRPSIVVDNSYGKVASFVDRWTAGSPLVRRAASHAEGLALALESEPARRSISAGGRLPPAGRLSDRP